MVKSELLSIKNRLYDKCSFQLSKLVIEKESQEYYACQFKLNEMKIIFRKAKITPTKTGQFVTIWKRNKNGQIQPFETTDKVDFFVVNVHKNDNFGQFVFPKSVLLKKGVISKEIKEGKRAIRVYPPWDITTSKQAINTQKWQLDYFLELDANKLFDINKAKVLYSLN